MARRAPFQPVSDGPSVVRNLFPGVVVTSGHRGVDDPTGKPNDWHHKSDAAVDVRPIHGMTFEQYVHFIKDSGYNIIEARDEATHPIPGVTTGPHWHVVIGENNA